MRSDWISSFLVFSEKLNFTHAARELHLSQPALYAQIKQLAEYIGKPLYFKAGRELFLSEAGEELARFAREDGHRRWAFLRRIHSRKSRSSELTIAAGEGILLYLLGKRLIAFAHRPEVVLRLLTRSRQGCIDALKRGIADMAITVMDASLAGWVCHPIAEFPQMLAVPIDHHLAGKDKVYLKQLTGETMILPPRDGALGKSLRKRFFQEKIKISVGMEARGWPLTLHFAALGMGLAIVNGLCHPVEGLRLIPIDDLPRICYVLFHGQGLCSDGITAQLKDLLIGDS